MSSLGVKPYRDNLSNQEAHALRKELRALGYIATVEPSKQFTGRYCVRKY